MKPGNRETVPTVADVVREAAAICDPGGADAAVTALFESFEDDDRPATAAEDPRPRPARSTRLVFEGSPPQPLTEWLIARGVEL
ncbi:MAG TPA: hypothetical protein VFN85_02365 [Solirubrobacterales bacterium]|nr:hypothetical protein [Solirubrobacterales bacterium]